VNKNAISLVNCRANAASKRIIHQQMQGGVTSFSMLNSGITQTHQMNVACFALTALWDFIM